MATGGPPKPEMSRFDSDGSCHAGVADWQGSWLPPGQ
jgi:hypothetical protein